MKRKDMSGGQHRPGTAVMGRRRFLKQTGKGLLVLSLSPVLSRCGGGDPGDPDETFHFAVLSDTHIFEREDAHRHTVMADTVTWLNTFSPALDFVVITGDVLDYLPSDDPAHYHEHHTSLHRLREFADGFRMPLHLVLGNHDYYTGGPVWHPPTSDRPARERLFMDWMGMPGPYYAFEHRGVKFYCLNTMQRDPSFDHDSNSIGIFGPEQVAWLDGQLRDGKPGILFHHHPLATQLTTSIGFAAVIPFEVPRAEGRFLKYRGTPFEDYTDPIYELLEDHRGQIRASFFGHSHLFMQEPEGCEGVNLFMTDSMKFPSFTRYPPGDGGRPMRFHIVACRAGSGTFDIYNAYMISYRREGRGSVGPQPEARQVPDPALFL